MAGWVYSPPQGACWNWNWILLNDSRSPGIAFCVCRLLTHAVAPKKNYYNDTIVSVHPSIHPLVRLCEVTVHVP